VLPADDGDGDDKADGDEKDEDTTFQEQIAKLRFEHGGSNRDPPEGVKNKFYPGLAYEYEYNYFQGMKFDNTVFDMQLNPACGVRTFSNSSLPSCDAYTLATGSTSPLAARLGYLLGRSLLRLLTPWWFTINRRTERTASHIRWRRV
jgi:hypothetical protein